MEPRRAWLALLAVTAACAGEVPPTDVEALNTLIFTLNRTQAAVDDLEVANVNLHDRLLQAEQETVASQQAIINERPGLLNVEMRANQSQWLDDLTKIGKDLYAEEVVDDSRLAASQKKADDVFQASLQLLATAERIMDPGTIKFGTGMCLDAPHPGEKGSHVRIEKCSLDTASQEWAWYPKIGQIQHRHGICLDSPKPGDAGGKVLMWTCSPDLPGQKWSYDESAGQIRSATGICLGLANADAGGSLVQMQTCNLTSSHSWRLVGGLGVRRELELLSKTIWSVFDRKSPGSVDAAERKQDKIEEGLEKLEGELTQKARTVLARRFQNGVDGLRSAMRQLGTAAWETKPDFTLHREKQQSTPPPFGIDLGLV